MWFKKNKSQTEYQDIEDRSKIEIIAHKRATKNQIERVKKVNKDLNDLFTANGFTLKIYLATGGRHQIDDAED